jgi:lysozyme family protein
MRVTFGQIVDAVLKREGGLVNDADDKGGLTKFGISQRAFPDEDIAKLTEVQAKQIYLEHYWKPSKAERLPESIRETYFDMVVNMGQRRGVKILQEACNQKGAKLVVDGKIGPNTIKGAGRLEKDRLTAFRVLHYAKIVLKNSSQMKFYYGWYRRSIEI